MKKFIAAVVAMTLCLCAVGALAEHFVIATDTVFKPFEYTDASGNFVGIDVDILANAILKDGSVGAKGMIAAGVYGDGSNTFRELNGEVNYYDADAAKAAWAKGCEELGYTPEKLTLLVRDDSVTASIATFVQDQIYSTLGVECVIDTKTTKVLQTFIGGENILNLRTCCLYCHILISFCVVECVV